MRYLIRSAAQRVQKDITIDSDAELRRKVRELSGQSNFNSAAFDTVKSGNPLYISCRPNSPGRELFGSEGFVVERMNPGMVPQPMPGLEPYLERHVRNAGLALIHSDTRCMLAVEDDSITLLDEQGRGWALANLLYHLYPPSANGDSIHN